MMRFTWGFLRASLAGNLKIRESCQENVALMFLDLDIVNQNIARLFQLVQLNNKKLVEIEEKID